MKALAIILTALFAVELLTVYVLANVLAFVDSESLTKLAGVHGWAVLLLALPTLFAWVAYAEDK